MNTFHHAKSAAKLALATLLISATGVLAETKYQAGTYQIDPMHSKVGFEVTHLKFSSVEGKFNQSEGSVELDEKFTKSKVKTTVDIASIDTGVEKRDGHLKSPEFFDVAQFPKMEFESTSITGTPASFKMNGNLTIKGTKKPVTFEGNYLGTMADGYGNEKVAFHAKAKISRKEFGLTWNNLVDKVPVVGDEVVIDLKIQAGRPKPAAKK